MKEATIRLEDFGAQYPAEAKWIEDNRATFAFATAMRERIVSHGFLTPNMFAAIHRCMDRVSPAQAEVDTTKLEAAFAKANQALRKPALNIGEFRFSPAPAHGANPGAIYVKREGEYLGKMLRGQFLARCSQDVIERVLQIAADPMNEAIKHGKLTGRCAVCSRKLTQKESVDRAMGAVCAAKFGW